MKRAERQTIALNVGLSAQYLVLFGVEFEVRKPKRERREGNRTPLVIAITSGKLKGMRIYNMPGGTTWASRGKALPGSSIARPCGPYAPV